MNKSKWLLSLCVFFILVLIIGIITSFSSNNMNIVLCLKIAAMIVFILLGLYLLGYCVKGLILKFFQRHKNIKKNKITIFALHLSTGGVEKFIHSLTEMLKNDYEIEILSTYKQSEKPKFDFDDNIKIKYLMNTASKSLTLKEAFRSKKYISFLFIGISMIIPTIKKHLLNIKAAINCDSEYIITTRYFHNNIVSKYAADNIVKIATEHDYMLNVKKIVDSCQNIDVLVLVSENLVEFYQKQLPNVMVMYIPNVVDEIKPKKMQSNNTYNIISVGRFSPEKGFDDLLDVFALMNNKKAFLHIAGDGQLKETLLQKAKDLKIDKKVKFYGFCPQNEVYELMEKCDLYVMTSHRESFGIVLLEAMAHSLPCIAFSGVYGAESLLSSTDVLISNRDKEEMAKKINLLLDNIEERNALIEKNYEKVLNYSIENVKKKWLKLLKQMVKM